MFSHEWEADETLVKGFRDLPVSWFWICLALVGVLVVLSIAEVVCVAHGGKLL